MGFGLEDRVRARVRVRVKVRVRIKARVNSLTFVLFSKLNHTVEYLIYRYKIETL